MFRFNLSQSFGQWFVVDDGTLTVWEDICYSIYGRHCCWSCRGKQTVCSLLLYEHMFVLLGCASLFTALFTFLQVRKCRNSIISLVAHQADFFLTIFVHLSGHNLPSTISSCSWWFYIVPITKYRVRVDLSVFVISVFLSRLAPTWWSGSTDLLRWDASKASHLHRLQHQPDLWRQTLCAYLVHVHQVVVQQLCIQTVGGWPRIDLFHMQVRTSVCRIQANNSTNWPIQTFDPMHLFSSSRSANMILSQHAYQFGI